MAIYHCSVKIISRSQGRSATGAAAYRAGEKIRDHRTDIVHDYTRKGGIDHTEILAPDNAPKWVYDRETLWNEVELSEKRKDSQLCREVEVALPQELDQEKNLELVREFINNQFVKNGMVADLAIHHAHGENPHAHIMLTTREISEDGFGKKNRDWNHKDQLSSWRESWEKHVNKSLERYGFDERIDHRTLEAQGIDRVPQIHIGPKVIEMTARGIETERGARALEIDDTNQKIKELQQSKEAIDHERNLEIERREVSTRTCERDRTIGSGHGDSSGSNERELDRATEREQSAFGAVDAGADEHSEGMGESFRGFEASSGGFNESDESRDQHREQRSVVSDSAVSHDFDDTHSGALERIVDLARPARRDQRGDDMDRAPDRQLDRSYLAARRHLGALKCDTYEIGIRRKDGKMQIRTWDQDQVLKSMSWLKRENAMGADIFIRPAGETNQGIILVDDLNRGQLDAMKSKGLAPAAVIETSPDNHQAWVRVSRDELQPKVATVISKAFASEFGADMNSADWRHFGRLAGFTNQKPEHKTPGGRSPWVLCHDSNGKEASSGEKAVEVASRVIRDYEAKREKEHRFESAIQAPEWCSKRDPLHSYQKSFKQLTELYGADMDLSRADFMISSKMLMQGFYKNQVHDALLNASPELPTRKAGHELDYCQRTVNAALASDRVQNHLKDHQHTMSREQDHDLSR